jgi:hypothetical protein
MQVGVVKELLRSTHRPTSEAAFLGSVVNFLCRQAGNKVGDEIIDYVRCVRCNDRRILVLPLEGGKPTQIPPFRGRQFGSGIFDRAHRTVAIVRLRTMQRNGSPGDDLALSRLVKRTMLPPTEPPGNW